MTGETVLVVDSDRELLKRLKRVLSAVEYEVETAVTVEQGLTRAVESPIALAIIGAGRDAADALMLVRKLAAESPQTQCVLLCEDREALDSPAVYETGNVFGLHQKPLTNLSDLGRDIGRAMEIYYLRRQNARLLVELRDARDDLRSQFEFLAQCEKLAALGQMTWDITDDLRSTLNEVEQYAAALRHSIREHTIMAVASSHDHRLSELVDGVARVALDGHALVRSINQFAEGGSAKEGTADLSEVVQSALGLLGHSFSARGIRVKTSLPSGFDPVTADPGRLRQAITHIAVNAVQSMPTGGTLSVSVSEAKDGGLAAIVRDTGIGIDPDALPNIFDPFFTTRPLGSGTGLGLYIAREIVREHGGKIEVESAPGRGSAFTIKLPTAAQAAMPEETALPLAA